MVCKVLSVLLGLTATFVLPLQAHIYYEDWAPKFWIEADYLYWQVQDSSKTIPLVIEQPVVDGPFDIVLGGKRIKNDWHSGGRFTAGFWFDECSSIGFEACYFFLGKSSKRSTVSADANGSPRLRVPYFNVNTGLPDSTALATPGLYTGRASLKVSNRMQGAELNVAKVMTSSYRSNAGFWTGFRYWSFDESLTFFANSPLVAVPTVYNNKDQFRTSNNFYGGQLGGYFDYGFSSFSFNVQGKLALGIMYQKCVIDGRFRTNEFTDTVQTFPGGYFALPTNMGTHKKTRFSIIPELSVNLGYEIKEWLRLHVGYTVLYASEVLRAAKQISPRINPTQSANIEFTPNPVLIGEPRPKANLRPCGLWTQGVNAGLDFAF